MKTLMKKREGSGGDSAKEKRILGSNRLGHVEEPFHLIRRAKA